VNADLLEAERRLRKIREVTADDEVAHSLEDDLHKWVLGRIVMHSSDPWARALAGVALRTRDLDFARWCA
jgi:hypothetical protein